MPLAARPTHHGSHTKRGRSRDETTRLGDDTHSLWKLRERRPYRRAKTTDVLNGLPIVDGEPTADVERIERSELLFARGGDELGAGLQSLDVLGRIPGLRAHMERQAAHADAEVRRKSRERQQILRITTKLAREIAYRPRRPERHPQ